MNKKKSSHLLLSIASLLAASLLTACTAHVQTSTREDWLAGYNSGDPTLSQSAIADEYNHPSETLSLDQEVRKIGEMSPMLNFPAKIGKKKVD